MKVLVISHMYPSSFNEVGGIFVHKQVKALVNAGLEIRVVSPIPWAPWPVKHLKRKWRAISKVPEKALLDGILIYYPRYLEFPRAWFFASSGWRMYKGIKRLVKTLRREFPFDLIHAHVALPDGYAGALLAQDFRKPLVITIHGQDLQHTVYRGANCKKKLGYALQNAAKVIVVSKKLYRLAVKHFDVTNKLAVIPNGVDFQEIAQAETNRKEKNNNVILLSVSNLVLTKGIEFNISAIRQLKDKYPNLQYWVVGSGPEERKLQALVARLGLEERVKFLGRQPHSNALRYMANCDVFSLPSWDEGFGIVYIEAMALGKPVIGVQGQGIDGIVVHGENGLLVKPHDVDSLVEALDFLLSHPEEAKAMGERARRLVLENYTWEKNAEKTIQVYKEVLDEY